MQGFDIWTEAGVHESQLGRILSMTIVAFLLASYESVEVYCAS
jgi:hypothetical protein